jgi:ADP-heptose:LPS heptosyltransferase
VQALSEKIAPINQIQPENKGRTVVVQLARLGDFLQTTPLLAAVKQASPQGELAVVVTPAAADLARGCGFVDRVLILDPDSVHDAARSGSRNKGLCLARLKGLLEPLCLGEATTLYNLNFAPLGPALAPLWGVFDIRGWRFNSSGTGLVGEPWTGFVMSLVKNRRLTRLHLSDILASYADPLQPPLSSLDYRVSPSDEKDIVGLGPKSPYVVLQLGANNDLRRWPVKSFAELGKRLVDQGLGLVLAGASRERILARRLIREMGQNGEKALDLMGRTSLPQLAAVLKGSSLVVSADTGTLHLATAVGARVLALVMGPAQVHETGPYGSNHLVLQARDQCGPCQEHNPVCKGKAPCRHLIAPRAVFEACKGLLAGSQPQEAIQGLKFPCGVLALTSCLDGFGQRYRLLNRRPLDYETGLGLSLRQGGRVLMRSAYRPLPEDLAGEIASEYEPPLSEVSGELDRTAKRARALAKAALASDRAAAARINAECGELAPLAGLIGENSPPRLSMALEETAQTLEAAACLVSVV